ncbi:MAG: arsenic resistance N-acetyltransferase ArsN2 [Pseudomonadota bacterium]
MSNHTLRDALASDLPQIIGLLATNDLPTEDLSADMLKDFVVLEIDDDLVGVAGLEIAGPDALLRSLAVAPDHQSKGLGRRLFDAIGTKAATRDVWTLYLLTTTAAAFFQTHGCSIWDRRHVPKAIGATAEFSGLCPDRAICLRCILI